MRQDFTLHDRYDLEKEQILLNGTQALVRLMLMQKARDVAAGWNTAGYVSGYRGSPLGAVDMQMGAAGGLLGAADILFQPGLNEDLAATALWGTQQAELRGEGRFDGVFGLWYGKGPGVDRSGDVMRHANMAGTAPRGGVVMAMGDDHTGESSTTLHQSDWAMVDAYMPVLSPAGVQEILDFGLYGWALSRFAGVWVGLKTMKDTIETTAVADGRVDRMSFVTPQEFAMPEGGLNIRLVDTPVAQETRMIDYKRFAAEAFSRANRMDRRMWGKPGATIGLVAAGKNWLDLVHALDLLGIDAAKAERLGLTTYKVGQTWPLDVNSFHEWAEGLDLIVVVEEKRKLIEVQVKEAIFDDRRGRRVYGWHKGDTWEHGRRVELFPTRQALDPVWIAQKLGDILIEEERTSDEIVARLERVRTAARGANTPELAARLPYFCSGCPHNSSTRLPAGARAYAGIGCHYMVQWMDRDTVGFTQMGGEGANWIGEAPFSTRPHVFQNLGDGTYNHSGIQAIRAALAAGTTVTFKLLYNDAVAMTGGQTNDGGLTADRIAAELVSMGVRNLAVVYDEKEEPQRDDFPKGVEWHERGQLDAVQQRFEGYKGTSVILYIQTCAAQKRRRRKRGGFPDPDKRVFINRDVCEGCGDCGVQSNCVSIVPAETDLGRKRAIDQSSCNKDFSCLNGFCPSFVTVNGGTLRKAPTAEIDTGELPLPELPVIDGTWNIVVTGVGGTGVVTIGAVLAAAAHIDGKGAGMMEMAGLAQKGGAVHIHCRLSERPEDISAIRVATGEVDALIGGDIVVSAGTKTLALCAEDRTGAVVNSHEIVTGDFTRDTEFRLPMWRLKLSLEARIRKQLAMFDSSLLSKNALGDTIYSNMILLGAAWQAGLVPLSLDAISKAIEVNGANVRRNARAFDIGRWATLNPAAVAEMTETADVPAGHTLDAVIDRRAAHLTAYQGQGLARRYRRLLDRIEDTELREAAAISYHKLLAYKDEYEVARLHLDTAAQVAEEFEGDFSLTFHLAPPLLATKGTGGRPGKRAFGPWVMRLFRLLAKLKFLRGTPVDPFGWQADRKMERALIRQYETDLAEVLPAAGKAHAEVLELLALPRGIRGFGPVKRTSEARAAKRREALLAAIRSPEVTMHAAE